MDDLGRMIGGMGAGAGDPMAAVGKVTKAVESAGGIDAVLGQLRAGGLGPQVDSWISPAPNQPVDADQVGAALGPDTVQRMAAGSGLDVAALLPMLAGFLPQVVDLLTPDGAAPAGGLAAGGMPDLGGLLGGLVGGASPEAGAVDTDERTDEDLLGGLGGTPDADRKG